MSPVRSHPGGTVASAAWAPGMTLASVRTHSSPTVPVATGVAGGGVDHPHLDPGEGAAHRGQPLGRVVGRARGR